MTLWEQIMKVYPDLSIDQFHPTFGSILLQDDSDDKGAYIVKWEYSKPIPKGFKLGK